MISTHLSAARSHSSKELAAQPVDRMFNPAFSTSQPVTCWQIGLKKSTSWLLARAWAPTRVSSLLLRQTSEWASGSVLPAFEGSERWRREETRREHRTGLSAGAGRGAVCALGVRTASRSSCLRAAMPHRPRLSIGVQKFCMPNDNQWPGRANEPTPSRRRPSGAITTRITNSFAITSLRSSMPTTSPSD